MFVLARVHAEWAILIFVALFSVVESTFPGQLVQRRRIFRAEKFCQDSRLDELCLYLGERDRSGRRRGDL